MKLGMWFVNVGPWAEPDNALTLIRATEDAGFDSLWTGDHPVMIKGYESRYPYDSSGKLMVPEETPVAEPLAFLAWAAAQTTRLKLCTGILILPHRNPVLVAKSAATLDVLSGGRLVLGLGIGWMREEFDAVGASWSGRAERLDEGIAAMRALWTQEEASFSGKYHSFERACSYPHPTHASGVPIVLGGSSLAAARRAGRLADGYLPMAGAEVPLDRLIEEMRNAATDAGRDPDAIEISWAVAPTADGQLPIDPSEIEQYEGLGVHRLVVAPMSFEPDSVADAAREFAAAYRGRGAAAVASP